MIFGQSAYLRGFMAGWESGRQAGSILGRMEERIERAERAIEESRKTRADLPPKGRRA